MKGQGEGKDPFWGHAGLAAGVAVVGVAVAALLPPVVEDKVSALWGVGLAVLSGAVALVLKRRAVKQDLNAALKMVGVVFALRAVCVLVGLLGMISRGLAAVPFIAGFFGVYFALQWIEVSYVMAASKGAAGGDE
ncbi:hypothetical protein JY651_37935 [Pyxidicoccus parkwayensis]|uniref:ATP synthase subunit I n=1 Tax=Pyxidicoccus parkwayensis TaxID=2813578 RepID=A0ABX7NQA0_9BACT|nr:hypothetical protein [Pyxidicoccus parkwaysis]QSQ20960.1 hypothetical protein JY651_37935 [Pyxidicoccus parkwaysis]